MRVLVGLSKGQLMYMPNGVLPLSASAGVTLPPKDRKLTFMLALSLPSNV